MATLREKTILGLKAGPRSVRSNGILTVTSGSDAGRVLSLDQSGIVTFGRAEECTYRFDDASVSGLHARVTGQPGTFVFQDDGSTNGSFVNDAASHAATPLRDGDRVQLGNATALRFSLVDDQEEAALKKVYEAALRDVLTGALNRRALDERLDMEIAHANRHHLELSIFLFDLDHFKHINDTHGHLGGDEVLRATSELVRKSLRADDALGRYGGEEFVVIARNTDIKHGFGLAERLRANLAITPFHFEGQRIPVTVSGGVSSLACCGERRDRLTLLSIADARLYRAKQSGRNQVVVTDA